MEVPSAKCQVRRKERGFSVFEILVVVVLFAGIVAIASQAFFSTLKSQNKSEAQTRVKQNANYIVSTMERDLHSAQNVSSCTPSSIVYLDNAGTQQTFSCQNGVVTHKGASLTQSTVVVSNCNFSCILEGGIQTVLVDAQVTIAGASLGVDEQSQTRVQTRIRLRN